MVTLMIEMCNVVGGV